MNGGRFHLNREAAKAARRFCVLCAFACAMCYSAAPAAPEFRGACYVTWGTPNRLLAKDSDDQIRHLHDLGVDCLALRVSWLQEAYNSTDIHPGYATPTDDSVRHVVQVCHSLGMKAMITLVLDFADPMKGGSYKWRGQIEPTAEEPTVTAAPVSVTAGDKGATTDKESGAKGDKWTEWFAGYEKFALHYARICEQSGADLFSLGCELTNVTDKFDQPWRELIRKIREVYKGPVTYQANWSPLQYAFGGLGATALLKDKKWNAEYRTVKFWDALDYATLCTYFSMSDKPNPPVEELEANLQIWRAELRQWQASINKPVIFAEVGYQSADRAAIEPWRTPLKTLGNPDLQARCYEAFLKTFFEEPWLHGLFWYFATPPGEWGIDDGGMGFPFMDKPAEKVVRQWFEKKNQ